MDVWQMLTPYHLYAVGAPATLPPEPGAGQARALASSAGPGVRGGDEPPWNPDNPMFWVGGLLLLTVVGIAAASTSVRLGPLRGRVSVGRESE